MTLGELLSESSTVNNATVLTHMLNLKANTVVTIRPECPGDTVLVLPEEVVPELSTELRFTQDISVAIIQYIEIKIIELEI